MKNRILVCQRDIHVLCICILYMYSVYVFCICTMYMYYVYVKNNNNNNNNPRVLGARGGLERSNPAKETTHSGRGEKETHYMNVVGINKYTYISEYKLSYIRRSFSDRCVRELWRDPLFSSQFRRSDNIS